MCVCVCAADGIGIRLVLWWAALNQVTPSPPLQITDNGPILKIAISIISHWGEEEGVGGEGQSAGTREGELMG